MLPSGDTFETCRFHQICLYFQLAERELELQRQENLRRTLNVDDQPLVRNTEPFTCPICFDDIQPGNGIMLRDCLHVFCELAIFVVLVSDMSSLDAGYASKHILCWSPIPEIERVDEAEGHMTLTYFELHGWIYCRFHLCGCCRPPSGYTVRGVSEMGPVINQGPHQIQN